MLSEAKRIVLRYSLCLMNTKRGGKSAKGRFAVTPPSVMLNEVKHLAGGDPEAFV